LARAISLVAADGATARYLIDFDRVSTQVSSAHDLYEQMLDLYPDRLNAAALWLCANAAKPSDKPCASCTEQALLDLVV
jgi:predicted TPR repeat methyltransferase